MNKWSLQLMILALTAASPSEGATADTLWIGRFGDALDQEAASLRPTSDGGYVMAGIVQVSEGYPFYQLFKLDSQGELEWERQYKGYCFLEAASAEQTADGGYLITGSDWEMSVGWIRTIKTAPDGSVEWVMLQQGSPGTTKCEGMIATEEGNYAMVGYNGGSQGGGMYFLAIDDQGTTVAESWHGISGPGAFLCGYGIDQVPGGGYVTACSGNVFGDGAILIRLDADGNEIWTSCAGNTSWDGFEAVKVLSDGSFVAAGYRKEDSDYNFLVSRFAPDGTILWTRSIGSPDMLEKATDLVETEDGGILVAGNRLVSEYTDMDMYLVKLMPDGTTEWECLMGGPLLDEAAEIRTLADGQFIIAGTSQSEETGKDFVLVRFQIDSQGIEVPSAEHPVLSCSPNPSHSTVEFMVGIPGNSGVLEIRDLSGRLLWNLGSFQGRETQFVSWNTECLNGTTLSPGVYIAVLRGTGFTVTERFVLIR